MIPHSYFLSPVGPVEHNDPHDITHAKMLMNRLGVLSRPKDGFSPSYDTPLNEAVRAFQERAGATGVIGCQWESTYHLRAELQGAKQGIAGQ